MSDYRHELITALKSALISQRYSPVVVRNYCTYASGFLDYLGQQGIRVVHVIDAQVEQYLRHAIVLFERQHGRRPSARWHEVPRSGIHALLRLAHGQWPPVTKPTCAADEVRFSLCAEYESWLREERGLARASIVALMWEARSFLAWQIVQGNDGFRRLSVTDIDRYMDLRAPKLTRSSLKSVAERLRSLLRYLYVIGRVTMDLSGHVIAPMLYA
jgi:integrase/recombinase XerD